MISIPQAQKWAFSGPQKSKFCSVNPQSRTLNFFSNAANEPSSAGRIKRQVLSEEGRTKLDKYPDRDFYAYPRFVTHVDNKFISTLKNLYGEILRPEMEILDLMSSWVSHLPEQVAYKKVVGHGLNAQELARNPRLDYFFVKDLNKEQQLEIPNSSFDAVLCTVSVQYLQHPEKVFIYRMIKLDLSS